MSGVTIRAGVPGDEAVVAGFQCAMARETEDKVLDAAVVERAVLRALEDPARGEYLVAELGGQVIGSLMLTREWSDWRDAWWVWIQSVYVAPEARRKGVYAALYARVQERVEARDDELGIRLYVEAENRGAQATYERLGMQPSTYRFYETPLPEGFRAGSD